MPAFRESNGDEVWKGRIFGGPLVCVKRLIGGDEHGFGQVAGYIFLPANGILYGESVAFPGHFKWANAVQDKLQLSVIALGKNQQEFVAPHANGEIASSNGSIESRGEFLKHEITSGVAVGVINRLEFVEVQKDHGQGMTLAGGASHLCREPLLGKPAVVEARQRVNHRQAAEYHRVILFFGKLSSQAFDEHLLIDGVSVEDDD